MTKNEEIKIWQKDYIECCKAFDIEPKIKFNNCPREAENIINKIIKKEMLKRYKTALGNEQVSKAKELYILKVLDILYDQRIFASVEDIKEMLKCTKKYQVQQIKKKLGGITW